MDMIQCDKAGQDMMGWDDMKGSMSCMRPDG